MLTYRTLETSVCSHGSYELQVLSRMGDQICRTSQYLGFQDANHYSSTTEAEYIALSMILRVVIPLMVLIKEVKAKGFAISVDPPKVHCKVFKDNSGALKMACLPKVHPRTKCMNWSFHFFRESVESKQIIIDTTPTEDLIEDICLQNICLKNLSQGTESLYSDGDKSQLC